MSTKLLSALGGDGEGGASGKGGNFKRRVATMGLETDSMVAPSSAESWKTDVLSRMSWTSFLIFGRVLERVWNFHGFWDPPWLPPRAKGTEGWRVKQAFVREP